MLTSKRIIKVINAAVYAAALVIIYMDLFVWRPQ